MNIRFCVSSRDVQNPQEPVMVTRTITARSVTSRTGKRALVPSGGRDRVLLPTSSWRQILHPSPRMVLERAPRRLPLLPPLDTSRSGQDDTEERDDERADYE